MPIYDFECPIHGEFEASVTFANADKPQPCPATVRSHLVGKKGKRFSKAICGKKCKRVARLYPANIGYCDGMTKHPAVIDSENTKKYGHCI